MELTGRKDRKVSLVRPRQAQREKLESKVYKDRMDLKVS